MSGIGSCAICGAWALPDPDNLCALHIRAQVVRDQVTLSERTEFPMRWLPVTYWELQTMPWEDLLARGMRPSLAWQVVFDDIMRAGLRWMSDDGRAA